MKIIPSKKHLLLSFFSLLVSFFFLEIFLRFTIKPEILPNACRYQDPILGNLLVPDSTCVFKTKEWDITYKINQQGFRDNYHDNDNGENNYRIMFLGDSFVEGYGVPVENTFSKIIESYTTKIDGRKVETISAGVAGWSPLTQYVFLKTQGLAYKPDVVFLVFNVTDFSDEYRYRDRLVEEEILSDELAFGVGKSFKESTLSPVFKQSPIFAETVNDPSTLPFVPVQVKYFLNQNSYLYRFISKTIKTKIGKVKPVDTLDAKDYGDVNADIFAVSRPRSEVEYEEILDISKKSLERISLYLNKNDIPFVLVLLPHGHMVSQDEWSTGRARWGLKKNVYPDKPLLDLEIWATEQGIETLNLTPLLKLSPVKNIYFDYDGHLTKEGNIVVSQAIISYLQALKLNHE